MCPSHTHKPWICTKCRESLHSWARLSVCFMLGAALTGPAALTPVYMDKDKFKLILDFL